MCSLEQILEATPHKTAAVQPPTSHVTNYPSKMKKSCGARLEESKKKLISDVPLWIPVRGFRSLVEVESTYWAVVKLCNTQNKLMDVHQSDISKILLSSTSNLVSFMLIKSRHFMEAYLILLHKTSPTSCVLFFFWFPRAGSRESTPVLRGKIVCGITITIPMHRQACVGWLVKTYNISSVWTLSVA